MKIVGLLPCLNEELTIGTVINQIQSILPEAEIVVIDNNSDDKSREVVEEFANVTLLTEENKGKGNVIKKAFDTIDADIYIMVESDATYDLTLLPQYIQVFNEQQIDYMNIAKTYSKQIHYNLVRKIGNYIFNNIILKLLLQFRFKDVLSGFKILSRNFVQNFKVKTGGFELETEMHIFAIKNKQFKCLELECNYLPRIQNSYSKLSIFKDGMLILNYLLFQR